MSELKIVVTGASGRMGAANIKAVLKAKNMVLHGAIDRKESAAIGKDIGLEAGVSPLDIMIADDVENAVKGADAIIDFSVPSASIKIAKLAAKAGLIHVIGTTGFTKEEETQLHIAAKNGARIIKSGNMSLGVNILAALVEKTAKILADDFDIEIVEMHHRHKIDAPSGTALLLGEAAAKGRKIDLAENSTRSRDGIIGERETGTIGFATLRGGSVVGEHSVIFAGASERIELTHKAEDRGLFANGAIKAVSWAKDKKQGLYSMADVLNLN